MSISAGQQARSTVSPTRRTSAPRKRGDDTRAKIIDETVRCIVEEGFVAATAKHVAERAGVTWGVIQYHFGDRDGLLQAVLEKHRRATEPQRQILLDQPAGQTLLEF